AHHSLPLQPTAPIGRTHAVEIVQAAALRPDCRLLTLLGPGGIGKTRLALAVAEAVANQFREGLCFVDLTQVSDAVDVPFLLTGTGYPRRLASCSEPRPSICGLPPTMRLSVTLPQSVCDWRECRWPSNWQQREPPCLHPRLCCTGCRRD